MKKTQLVMTLVVACASAGAQDSKTPPPKPVLQVEGGRYVFGQISDWRSDQFMLDTKTGRLWQVVVSKNEKGETTAKMLQPVPYSNLNDDKWSLEPK